MAQVTVVEADMPEANRPATAPSSLRPSSLKRSSLKPSGPAPAGTADPARHLPLWVAILLAAASGGVLLTAFPPVGLWWAAPIAVALFTVAVHGRRPRAGFGLGVLTGALFFTPLLAWTNLHTGTAPWLLLSGMEAVFLGLLGVATGWITTLRRHGWAWAVLIAALWVTQEALRDRAPFGGFPWGRVAFSQDTSPLLHLAAVGGAPLVTFGVTLAGALLALPFTAPAGAPAALRPAGGGLTPRVASRVNRVTVRALAGPVLAVAVVGVAWLVPLSPARGPAVYVAVVQGNVPRLGLDFNAQRRAVLDNHVRATVALGRQVTAGTARHPDLVVWPENSSDIDPLRNPDAAAAINTAARAVGAPILVGAVLTDPAVGVQNAALVWQPDQGVSQRYTKRHPVPFAETIPLRGVARMISKEVDRVSDMTAGHAPGVLQVGPATVGDVICFEVAYDGLVRDTVVGGGQLLSVQTNNATFNEAEARQQLAMVRLRAVEHGRDALMASTVGISAFADATGRTHAETPFNDDAVIERELHLATARTLATRLGAGPEYLIVALAVAGAAAVAVTRRRTRRLAVDHGQAPTGVVDPTEEDV